MASVAHVRGSIVGAMIMTLFGSVWCILSLTFWTARPAWSIPAGYLATLTLLGLCGSRLAATRRLKCIEDPVAAAKGKRVGIIFGAVFATEGALIGLCSWFLAREGLDVWIPVAAAAIVGGHFIPLARVFEVRVYYWTGAAAVFGMAGCCLIDDISTRQLCAGLVMATVLWVTAIAVLQQVQPIAALKGSAPPA